MKYLKEFIIGTSSFIYIPWMISVQYTDLPKRYSYYDFTMVSPIRGGIWNLISIYIATLFNLSNNVRFIASTIIHWLLTIIYVNKYKLYVFKSKKRRYIYYFNLLLACIIQWNVIIPFLENNI
mgnify:FL=1